MSAHLGADLAALVDGELDHPSRERVLRHLTRCLDCRAEVTAQRCVKSQLRAMAQSAPPPAGDLADRLRAVSARPGLPPEPARRLPRAAMAGAVLAVGLGVVLALAGPHRDPVRVPSDPAGDVTPLDHAGTAIDLPLPEPAGVGTVGLRR